MGLRESNAQLAAELKELRQRIKRLEVQQDLGHGNYLVDMRPGLRGLTFNISGMMEPNTAVMETLSVYINSCLARITILASKKTLIRGQAIDVIKGMMEADIQGFAEEIMEMDEDGGE